jgi:hypothetical protein
MKPQLKPQPLTLREALEIIGGFSDTTKMPWLSWSTPAQNCVTGSKLRQKTGTTCSKCYALRGNYLWPNAQAALERRLRAINHPRFIEAFVFALNEKFRLQRQPRSEHFRWHDSGDLQSLRHLEAIDQIALGTPKIKHWLPTRERQFVKQFLASGKRFAPNLMVRVSFPMVGGKLTNPDALQSTVGRDKDESIWQCPAKDQGNKCGSCRACWDPNVETVNYRVH